MGCTKHFLRVDVLGEGFSCETAAPTGATPEKLFCALVPVLSKWQALARS
jgi:hypothetical protein